MPLGRYARIWLDRQGLSDSLDSRTIVTEHARATTAAVEHGHADAAIVYKTDALGSSDIEISFEISSVDQPEIIYSAALLRSASRNRGAQEFFAYLQKPEALDALEALESGDAPGDHLAGALAHVQEELGDLLFQVVFHSRIAVESGHFDLGDVAQGIHDKLHHRHPHVFGDTEVSPMKA